MDPKKVLVVDDEPDCIAFVRAVLKDLGLDSLSAADGQAGLDLARAHKPDLVVMDVDMPVLNGFQALKAHPETRQLPAIMLTGIRQTSGIGFSADDLKEYFPEPPQAYLEKPIEAEKLPAAVKNILSL